MRAVTVYRVDFAKMTKYPVGVVMEQRPGLKAMISTDIAALTYVVALGEKLFPQLRALDLPVVVSEFSNILNQEIDFSREARSIVLFRSALADDQGTPIPLGAFFSAMEVIPFRFNRGRGCHGGHPDRGIFLPQATTGRSIHIPTEGHAPFGRRRSPR